MCRVVISRQNAEFSKNTFTLLSRKLCCLETPRELARHSQVNDLIKRALVSAGIPAVLEPQGVSRDDGKRPDGMSLVPWKRGKPLVWDFTCADTLAPSHLQSTSKSAGSAAITREKLKIRKYHILEGNYIFHPVAIETLGVFGPQSLSFIHEIGRKLGLATGEKRSTSFLIQRISIAIQRGNASSLLGTIPPSHHLDEILYLPESKWKRQVKIGENTDESRNDQSQNSSPVHISDIPISNSSNIALNALVAYSKSQTNSKPEANMAAYDSLKSVKRKLYLSDAIKLGWKNSNWLVGAGMVNMGNTCYLNSTLQALFHVPSLVNWLLSDKKHIALCQEIGCLCIICAIRKTLQYSQQSTTTSFSPILIYNKLQLICQDLIPGRQEDAHEFLRYLIDAMNKAYLSRFKDSSEFDSEIEETTPLNQILGGFMSSAVSCLKCGHVSTTFQHFQDLLLDIREAQTLDEALKLFFSEEKLDNESYQCESCNIKVQAAKQFSLERAPMVLFIQLKRFSINNNKITKHVAFTERLDLTRYARKRPNVPLSYRLVAVVTHMGPSVSCGHYTAIAQTPSGQFYQYDDSMVRPVSHQFMLNTNAYIMLYEMEFSPNTQKTSAVPPKTKVSTPPAETVRLASTSLATSASKSSVI